MDRMMRNCFDRPAAVEGRAATIHDAAEELRPDGHAESRARGSDPHAAHESGAVLEGQTADPELTELCLHFEGA